MADGVGIGIDIGGTFTDVVALGPEGPVVVKVPSTRADPAAAVEQALSRLADEHGIAPGAIARFCHGTTVATNAVLQHRGARVGLITTRGFRDVLELGRQMRRQMYDLRLRAETPTWLVPGARRVEVDERIAATGEVVTPLDEGSLAAAVERLRTEGVEAVAVCLIFGFLNPVHERRIRAYLREAAPDWPVSLSSEVDPVFREYERTLVTALDAYVKPVVSHYIARMEGNLARAGVPAPLQVMQSRGGLAIAAVARERPVRLFLSGPAAGVIGALSEAQAAGACDIISIDVGGTSSDIALVEGGTVAVRPVMDVEGFAVRVPTVDVVTLGAGGGSIAWIDSGGGLRVGPHSAGADPGPAAYGAGGAEPTVTDASLVLGYLAADAFAGGRLTLDRDAAKRAIEERVARPLGMSVEAAALGIHRVANAQMGDGIRLVSLKRGLDARDFALVSLGGGGGIHAASLAEELGIGRVLVPRFPGVLSAAGLLAAPIEHEASAAVHVDLAAATVADLDRVFAALDARVAALMAAEHVEGLARERRLSTDMAYAGQSHLLEVPFDPEAADPLAALYASFEATHARVNGHATGAPARIVNLRVVHQARHAASIAAPPPPETPGRSQKGTRRVLYPGGEVEAAIHDRARLALGERIAGLAVVEQDDTTTLVPAGWSARTLATGAMLMEREGGT
jgi:N-methylhydantoinase A